MPALSSFISLLPPAFQARLAPSLYVAWANELLQQLSGEGFFPETDVESGVVVYGNVWVDKPAGCRTVRSIVTSLMREIQFEEVNGKIRLVDATISADENAIGISAFSSQTTISIEANIDGYGEDDLVGYLLVITAGLNAGRTYVVASNDESSDGTTVLRFLHALPSAITAEQATAGELVSEDFYLMMKYVGSYVPITSTTDEVPISDEYERIVFPFLRWKCEQRASSISNETMSWGNEFQSVLTKLRGERLSSSGGPFRGRRLTGYIRR